ncbi:MAG TPA: Hsp20/alpha crystallin family protein [Polyangiaceae bacterium]|jgi:HSP20 family molecular chaperone IbpA
MSQSIPIEVHHGKGAVAVVVRLPDVRAKDIRISLTRDELSIHADTPGHVRNYSLRLATRVDDRRATMRFSDGVLWMHLPVLRP